MNMLRLPGRHQFAQAARQFRTRLPKSKAQRTLIGSALVAGGTLSALPFLGFWMLPVGLVVLSIDWPRVRRLRRRMEVRLLRPAV